MIIKWTEDAITDLQSLRHYIAHDKPSAAHRIAKKILKGIEQLSVHPGSGRAGRVSGTRELVIADTPYIVPYRIKNNTVEVLRIFHGAMQWPEIF